MRKRRMAEQEVHVACHMEPPAADIHIPTLGEIGSDALRYALNDVLSCVRMGQIPSVNRILVSGNATIVFWADDTKTVVRCAKGETPDLYAAFTAALGIKIYGSNSQLKKIIDRNTVIQKPKKVKKPADPEPMTAAEDVLASGV